MTGTELHVVTGAFGYSGKYIARRLLDAGYRVRTLTNRAESASPFGDQVQAHPLSFDDYPRLCRSLEGASVLHNAYWIRFNRTRFTHGEVGGEARTNRR